jgi:hypothetical protein
MGRAGSVEDKDTTPAIPFPETSQPDTRLIWGDFRRLEYVLSFRFFLVTFPLFFAVYMLIENMKEP